MAAVAPPQSNSGNNAFKVRKHQAMSSFPAIAKSGRRIKKSPWLFAMPILWQLEVYLKASSLGNLLNIPSSRGRCHTDCELLLVFARWRSNLVQISL